MLRYYQKYTIDKILENDNVFICWNRQSGKNYTIDKFIEYYVNHNFNKRILYIVDKNDRISDDMRCFLKVVDGEIIEKIKNISIDFINNNELLYSSINNIENIIYGNYFGYIKFDLVVYNDCYKKTNIFLLNDYINRFKCKSIFSTWRMDIELFRNIDYNKDYYVSVIAGNNYKKMDIMLYFDKTEDRIDLLDNSFERKYKLKKLQGYEKENN